MTTLTCDTCESEIDTTADPRCVVYDPSGSTDVICADCRERAYQRWQEEGLMEHSGPPTPEQQQAEAKYLIKRGWRA